MSQPKPSDIRRFHSKSLADTADIGGTIAAALSSPACVYLQGEMGAGKTTLCKAIIEHLGYVGAVTSPTYNLIQEYPVSNGIVYHMDLYRVQQPEEVAFLALPDLWTDNSLFLIEWPDNGVPFLPKQTHCIEIRDCPGSNHQKEICLMLY